ncbi:MAG: carbohydrate kinase [Verrucomicrobia bacterium]|nr:carbohydrate kinase [Verrucomicrobiota bacterium]
MTPYFLGIDNGGTLSKAALFRSDGVEVASASRKVAIIESHPGWSERSADVMWQDTAAAIREVLENSAIDPAAIAAIACTGHGNGLYLVDAAGAPVRHAINSMDGRAAAIAARWKQDGTAAKALPLTAQCVWPAQPNALLVWLREYEPEAVARASAVLFAKDFTRLKLTGEIRAELTDMSGSSLMNVVTGQYDDAVLELFGILDFKHLLPPLNKSHDLCGGVTPQAAAATGLAVGTPVAGGMFDIDACGLASGIVDEAQMSLVSGTWGNNQYIARTPLLDKDLFMTSCYSIPGWFLMLEGSPTSASNLEWFVAQFLDGMAPPNGKSRYAHCDELVAELGEPSLDTPIFLPFLYGCNLPAPAAAAFVGLKARHSRQDMLRAVYEGVVFSHFTHLKRLLQFRPVPASIRFTGGAARSAVWVKMFADCFQIPIEIPAGSELGALGAAIAAAVAIGHYPDYPAAVRAMTRIDHRHAPDPTLGDIYQLKFSRYLATAKALAAIP